ncbi:MAG TPA: nickel/cobalt efflux protein RcnA, partial [Candidatus Competibacteraceae bacterium]|nr:nickel/cobalt efflux protein RcnA [Candidatus Competibacteraceae bacterium]
MSSFAALLQQGASQAWFYFPSAILLGALHGLEPGHSKTMMAAFIVAIRGTVRQAVLLGLAATLSHTAVVWLVAMAGMYLGQNLNAATTEPYFQLASAAIIITVALWMLWRTWRGEQRWFFEEGDEHQHDHHHDETHCIDTGHGRIELSIFEDGVPPRWRLRTLSGHDWPAAEVSLLTTRHDGLGQQFRFVGRSGYLESLDEIPEPHAFTARLSLGHAGHSHDHDLEFHEHNHGHDHDHTELEGLELSLEGYQDAHERAHANDIRKRFGNRNVTTGQIILFGLTGGLIPCPAAITVLLLCLQVKEVALGAVLVLCFSLGLAITLVTVGAAAAIGA